MVKKEEVRIYVSGTEENYTVKVITVKRPETQYSEEVIVENLEVKTKKVSLFEERDFSVDLDLGVYAKGKEG